MALSIRRFSKVMGKQKFIKGDKKDKFRSKTKREELQERQALQEENLW
jgi:hypothetical protein